MEIPVVPIGNSKGIRIPKTVLQQLKIEERLEMEVHENEIVLKPVSARSRSGWKEAFRQMAEKGDDSLLLSEIESGLDDEADGFEWEW